MCFMEHITITLHTCKDCTAKFYIMQLSNSREGMAMERAGILLSIDIAHTPIHRRIAVTAPQ